MSHQGFRHAATLLMVNRARAIPVDALPPVIAAAINDLARALVKLADDTRAPADASEWLIAEFASTIDRLPQNFDRRASASAAAAMFARIGARRPAADARDLFLIYVPEDRLPIAAPLAVELTKRRVSVAFAEFEVATPEELDGAVERGLTCHRAGVVLWTAALERAQWQPPAGHDRLTVLRSADLPGAVLRLSAWATRFNAQSVKNTDTLQH